MFKRGSKAAKMARGALYASTVRSEAELWPQIRAVNVLIFLTH